MREHEINSVKKRVSYVLALEQHKERMVKRQCYGKFMSTLCAYQNLLTMLLSCVKRDVEVTMEDVYNLSRRC